MKILIVAGGTAGHINPAIAIADALQEIYPNAEIHFAGREKGMENALVKRAGYDFHSIEITGFQRQINLTNIKRNAVAVWNLMRSVPKANAMLKAISPDLVIGCGGYVSGPVVRAAAKRKIKTAIHEQNAFPGVTNKLLAKDVDVVFAAVAAAVPKLGAEEKSIVVGNPVRREIFSAVANRIENRAKLGVGDKTVILSFGGSLGARRMNEVVADLCAWEQKTKQNIMHIHATGKFGVELFEELKKQKNIVSKDVIIKEYIENMAQMLSVADLVICRAGALTLAEISAVGRASVLIPSPNVAENHQYHNALELQKIGAALVLEEKDLTGEKLIETVEKLIKNKNELVIMGKLARTAAVEDSLEKITNELKRLIEKS